MEKKKYNFISIPFDTFIESTKNSARFEIELTEEEYETYQEVLDRLEYWQKKLIGMIK